MQLLNCKRMAAMAVAAVLAPIGATIALAAPAQAACSDYFLCAFQYADYNTRDSGYKVFTSQSNDNWDYAGNPAAFRDMNDKATSAISNTSQTYAAIWQHDSYSGAHVCMSPGQRRALFADDINNKSSSHRFYSSCP